MTYRFHGNYCGPGWTGGKYLNAEKATADDFKAPAIDALDAICKKHDRTIWKASKIRKPEVKEKAIKNADRQFVQSIKQANIPGVSDNIASFAVWALGPGTKIRKNFISEFAVNSAGDMVKIIKKKLRTEDGNSNIVTPDRVPTRKKPLRSVEMDSVLNLPSSGETISTEKPNMSLGKEIEVKKHDASYGIPNVHTTVLPAKHWACIYGLNEEAAIFKINYNSCWNWLHTGLSNPELSGTDPYKTNCVAKTFHTGNFTKAFEDNSTPPVLKMLRTVRLGTSPGEEASAAVPSEYMYYRDYFSKIYKSYTVLSTEISITFDNVAVDSKDHLQVGWMLCSDETMPPDTIGSKGVNIMAFDAWEQTKRKLLPSGRYQRENGRETLDWTLKSGDATHEALDLHKVVDGTVQSEVWTKCGSAPADKEFLLLYFWKDNLGFGDSAVDISGLNMEINLKFLVQFRDKRYYARYPIGKTGAQMPAKPTITETNDTIVENFPGPNDIVPEVY